jgi:hypothetical protein
MNSANCADEREKLFFAVFCLLVQTLYNSYYDLLTSIMQILNFIPRNNEDKHFIITLKRKLKFTSLLFSPLKEVKRDEKGKQLSSNARKSSNEFTQKAFMLSTKAVLQLRNARDMRACFQFPFH